MPAKIKITLPKGELTPGQKAKPIKAIGEKLRAGEKKR